MTRYSQASNRPINPPLRWEPVVNTFNAVGDMLSEGLDFLARNAVERVLFMSSTESVSPDDVIVCACGTHEYTARDAIDAAIFRGELEAKWQTFLSHVAAEDRARRIGNRFGRVGRFLLRQKNFGTVMI